MRSLTVLVDFDDTMTDFCSVWIDSLNKAHGYDVKISDITQWDITPLFPNLTAEQLYAPLHSRELWKRVSQAEDCGKRIEQLIADGHKVYIATASHCGTIQMKYELAVKRLFPFIKWQQIIVISHKQLLTADVLIDDGIHNLEGGSYRKILFTRPHNARFDTSGTDILRADNWQEVINIIKIIEKEGD